MKIVVNGTSMSIDTESANSLHQTLVELGYGDRTEGLAVAVNDSVIPKSKWSDYRVPAGARLEVIQAVQGG